MEGKRRRLQIGLQFHFAHRDVQLSITSLYSGTEQEENKDKTPKWSHTDIVQFLDVLQQIPQSEVLYNPRHKERVNNPSGLVAWDPLKIAVNDAGE